MISNETIFITGGAGFIGATLAARLIASNKITVFDNFARNALQASGLMGHKNLTIINIVFLPLNLVAGIGGMSEFTMWTTGIDWRVSYTILLVAMLLIGWVTAFLLGRMGFPQQGTRKRVHRRKSPLRQRPSGAKNE